MEKKWRATVIDYGNDRVHSSEDFEEVGQAMINIKVIGNYQYCEREDATQWGWQIQNYDKEPEEGDIMTYSGNFDAQWNPIIISIKVLR